MRTRALALFLCLCLLWPLAGLSTQAQAQTPQYTGVTLRQLTLRAEPDRSAARLAQVNERERVQIYAVTQEWLYVSAKRGEGYLLRDHVGEITPVNESVGPYGVVTHHQIARVAVDTQVYGEMDTAGTPLCPLTAGSAISFWYIQEGWAVIPHMRGIGYVQASALEGVTPAAPTVDYARDNDLLSAFTSFYATTKSEMNSGRIVNIGVACKLISIVVSPGERFSFYKVAGPYGPGRGYQLAPVLYEGVSTPGYGGGTCQVSTTLYNAVLQLPGIEVVRRRAHGPSGARYVPHGMDAAVGNADLDLAFENRYPFPVRIEASAQDGALFVAVYKAG